METINYEELLPLEPKEDILTWAQEQGAFRAAHLVYHADWIPDPLTGAKRRGVRVVCTGCGDTFLAERSDSGGCHNSCAPAPYGWWNWRTNEAVIHQQVTPCPVCGCEARTIHIGGLSWYVSGEKWVSTFSTVQVDGAKPRLALCDWLIRQSIGKDGQKSYAIWPYTAWVVEEKKIIRLMAYTKYMNHVRLMGHWAQRKQFCDVSGRAELVFPWEPAILKGTTAENCKLDRYMEAGGNRPVGYLALWRRFPAVENLVVQGCGRLLNEMMDAHAEYYDGYVGGYKPRMGVPKIPEIDFKQKRPAQMLGLNKAEFQFLRQMKWRLEDLRNYRSVRDAALRVHLPEDMEPLRRLNNWEVCKILETGDFWRTARYLEKQGERWDILSDYWRMAKQLGRDLEEERVRWPKRLKAAHDHAWEELREIQNRKEAAEREKRIAERAEKFKEREAALSRLSFALNGLLIRPCADEYELIREGKELHHCVGNYARSHAEGKTAILFIRKAEKPDDPFFTLEFDEKTGTVLQNRGLRNCDRTEEVRAFEAAWLDWLKEAPARTKRRKKKGAAA